MNVKERIDFKKFLNQNPSTYEDNTEGIRRLKHSELISADILTLQTLKKQYAEIRVSNPSHFLFLCQSNCSFLYNSYTDIFNRVFKDELDLALMSKALYTLQQIENGKINQEEGSILMGKLFYEIYVDSALKQGEKNDKIEEKKEYLNNEKNIHWKDFKKQK